MNSIYEKIRNQALDIASRYPATAFYQNYPEQVAFSQRTFESDPVVGALHDFCVSGGYHEVNRHIGPFAPDAPFDRQR